MKSIQQILEEANFDPTQKLLEVYQELEIDAQRMEAIIEQDESNRMIINPLDNQKIRAGILNGIVKSQQLEYGNVIKLKELEAKSNNTQEDKPVISAYVEEVLPDGRKVVKRIDRA
jgi:hypothetical protein